MNELEKLFEKEIDNMEFTVFEITGFKSQPKLALVAGMAMGYKLALNNQDELIKRLTDEKP